MKHTLKVIAVTAALLYPLAAVAAQLETSDTVAGLGTDILISDLRQNTNLEVVVLPPYGAEVSLPVSLQTEGVTSVQLPGSETEVAGTYDVQLVDLKTESVLASSSFEVLPDTMDPANSTLQTDRMSIEPDGTDTAYVSVILRDRFGNTLRGRPVQMISSRAEDSVTAVSGETDANGKQEFAVSTFTPGTISLRAMDLMSGKLLNARIEIQADSFYGVGGYATTPAPLYNTYNTYTPPAPAPSTRTYNSPSAYNSPSYQEPQLYGGYETYGSRIPSSYNGNQMIGSVLGRPLYGQISNFDVISSYTIEAPSALAVNEDATIRITAVDRNGYRVEDYLGTVYLSSTDPTAYLPLNGEIQFLPQNLGEKVLTLGLRFRTPGEHILYAEDSTDPNVNAQVIITVTGNVGSVDPTITITSHENDGFVNTTNIILEGKGPPFINLVVSGGLADIPGETDMNGNFSIAVPLKPDQIDHTLRVRDGSGRFDSGDFHLTLDTKAPEIGMITFDPATPHEGDTVNLSIESEPGLASMTVVIEDEEYTLTENTVDSGIYEVNFSAPEPRTYQPKILAVDPATNKSEVRANLVVAKRSLPKVENVIAESKVNAVALRWDPIASERVDNYRIYVGEDQNSFLYTLDTDRATAAATVAGLDAGTTYYFSVTALQGDRESIEKSDTVAGSALGLGLDITEQNGALLIEWSSLAADTPLASYLLEYGIDPEAYSEQRTISGELRAYNLRDLINGVTYHIRLTPVATTGNVLHDLAAKGSGTPVSPDPGFIPTTESPIPANILPTPTTPQPTPPFHGGAPETPTTGIPMPIWWIAFGLSACALFLRWNRRRTIKMTLQFLEGMESRYRQ